MHFFTDINIFIKFRRAFHSSLSDGYQNPLCLLSRTNFQDIFIRMSWITREFVAAAPESTNAEEARKFQAKDGEQR